MMSDYRPKLTLERNNAGTVFIGMTEFDSVTGMATRACVLAMANEYTADIVMERRFNDMVRVMGENVQT
jgi:hypothetical protein